MAMRSLRPLSLALVAATLLACSPWPTPNAAPRLPADGRLGIELFEASQLRSTYFSFNGKGEKSWLVVRQGAGRRADLSRAALPELAWFEVDATRGVVRTLQPWPHGNDATPDFEVSAAGVGGFLAGDAARNLWAFFDGAAWSVVPPPPVVLGRGDLLVANSAERIFGRVGNEVFALQGGTWKRKAGPSGSLALGTADATGITVSWVDPGQTELCTAVMGWSDLAFIGSPVCIGGITGGLMGDAVNGSPSAFHALIDRGIGFKEAGTVYRFAGGEWRRGADLERVAAMVTTPGAAEALVRGTQFGRTLRLRDGLLLGQVAPPVVLSLECGCHRGSDPTCGCSERGLTAQASYSANGERLDLAAVSDADGRRVVTLRRLPLPFFDPPFASPKCDPVCAAGLHCESSSEPGGPPEVCVPNLTEQVDAGELPRGRISVQVRSARDTGAWSAALEGIEGLPVPQGRVVTPPPELVIEGKPGADFTLVVGREGHSTERLALRFPGGARTADLGEVALWGGERIGQVPADLPLGLPASTPVATGSALLVPVGEDGGIGWVAVEPSDGGVKVRRVAAGRTDGSVLVPPLWLPRAQRVAVPGPQSLVLLDDLTFAEAGSLPGNDWKTAGAALAADVPVVALRRTASTEVIRVGPSTPRVMASLPSRVGEQMQLSGQGTVLLQQEGTWVAYLTATSTPTALESTVAPMTLTGDGLRAFFTRPNGRTTELHLRDTLTAATELLCVSPTQVVVDPSSGDFAYDCDEDGDGGVVHRRTTSRAGIRIPYLHPAGDSPARFTGAVARLGIVGTYSAAQQGGIALETLAGLSIATLPSPSRIAIEARPDLGLSLRSDCDGPTCRWLITGLRGASPRDLPRSTGLRFGTDLLRAAGGNATFAVDPATGAISARRAMAPINHDVQFEPRVDALGSPCALFSAERRRFVIDPQGGVVATAVGRDWYCGP